MEREEAPQASCCGHRRRLLSWPSGCCRSTASSAHGPARPAGGRPARCALRHRDAVAAGTPAPTTRRASSPRRSSRARWSRWSTTRPAADRRPAQWRAEAQRGDPGPQGRRHRDRLGSVPRRRRPLPRRPPGRGMDARGRRARPRLPRATRGTGVLDADEDPVVVEARRQVVAHCLYGVDINAMAVEMASCRSGWSPWTRAPFHLPRRPPGRRRRPARQSRNLAALPEDASAGPPVGTGAFPDPGAAAPVAALARHSARVGREAPAPRRVPPGRAAGQRGTPT